MAEEMVELHHEPWWSLLIRGILIMIFSFMAFAWPGLTLELLMIFFGAFVLIDGIFAIVVSVTKRHKHRGLTLAEGVVGIVIGSLALIGLVTGGLAVFYLVATWFMVTGIIRIVTATRVRDDVAKKLRLTVGITSVCFGVAIFIMSISIPALLSTFWIIALFAMLVSAFLIVDAFRLRQYIRKTRGLWHN